MNLSKPIVIAVVLLLGACTSVPSIVGKVAGVVAKPVLGLAVKDARTTLAWVNREVSAGRLSDADATLAKQCPEAVLTLDALRAKLEGGAEDMEGFKGLIYFGTLKRFSRGPQADVTLYLTQLANSCVSLIPADRLRMMF